MYYAVIGNNYGDEGKGLAVDYLTRNGNALVVRHNGGAQSAHTVDREDKRFVFHELSSGSFNGADTYWADTFFPDLYKLEEEISDLSGISRGHVTIYASPKANITLLYDVYLNQKKEESRGRNKHGSCGMGIWEAAKRSQKGFGLTLGDISSLNADELALRLDRIEKDYLSPVLAAKKIPEPLELDNIRYASILKDALESYVTLTDDEAGLLRNYDDVVFEGGQGLLLDTSREELWPHTTCSNTNIINPVNILDRSGLKLDEAVYVTRSYLTRHGAGPFDEDKGLNFDDKTNIPNPWQDNMRFGRFESALSPVERALKDRSDNCSYEINTSLFITHLDETKDMLLVRDGDTALDVFTALAFDSGIDKLYISRSRFAKDIKIVTA